MMNVSYILMLFLSCFALILPRFFSLFF